MIPLVAIVIYIIRPPSRNSRQSRLFLFHFVYFCLRLAHDIRTFKWIPRRKIKNATSVIFQRQPTTTRRRQSGDEEGVRKEGSKRVSAVIFIWYWQIYYGGGRSECESGPPSAPNAVIAQQKRVAKIAPEPEVQTDIFSLKHESSIFRSVIQPCTVMCGYSDTFSTILNYYIT